MEKRRLPAICLRNFFASEKRRKGSLEVPMWESFTPTIVRRVIRRYNRAITKRLAEQVFPILPRNPAKILPTAIPKLSRKPSSPLVLAAEASPPERRLFSITRASRLPEEKALPVP